MKKYYFLSCVLPKISIEVKPDLSFEEADRLLNWNLSFSDKKKLTTLKLYIDIKNLKALWLEKEIDGRGNLDEKGIDEAILLKDFFPPFVFSYMEKYQKKEERVRNFSLVISSFLHQEIQKNTAFLSFYFQMEREIRVVCTALRASKFSKDLSLELSFEDSKDPLIASLLEQKGKEELELPKRLKPLKDIFFKYQETPQHLHRKLLEYRFQQINDEVEKRPFTIDQILGYLVCLILVEEYFQLDTMQGKVIIDSLVT